MNQKNLDNYSPKNKRIFKKKVTGWNRLRYLTLTAFMVSLSLTFFASGWLPIGQSFGYNSQDTNQEFLIAQEEEREERGEETRERESAEERESEERERESAEERESEERESAEERESEPEGELSFEEAKESLEEEIDERYEEWESAKKRNEFSHSISAISTIIMTVIITFLGMEILQPPYRRSAILAIGIITVLIQLNNNIFLLEKSLVGYDILKEQSLILKNKLEEVETEEELKEIREQFQELKLESIEIE